MPTFDFTKFMQVFLDIHDSKFIPWSNSLHDSFSINYSSNTITLYLTSSLSKSICPRCGCIDSHYFKDYRTVTLHHSVFNGYKVILVVRYRRYCCYHCCNELSKPKIFKEDISFRISTRRYTSSFVKSVIFHLRENYSLKSISRTHFVSYSTIYHLFVNHIQIFHKMYTLPTYLSIDEFKATTGAGKYAFNICDPIEGKVLDILEDRRQESVIRYFQRFTMEQRNHVKYVVMDMSSSFRSMMQTLFPKAIIVVDKFHVVQLLSRNFIKERVAIMKKSDKRKYKLLKKYWKLFLKKHSKLDKEEKKWNKHLKMYVDQSTLVSYLLGLDDELNDLYQLYQEFLTLMETKEGNYHIQLRQWIEEVETNGNPSFIKVSQTYTDWFEEIIQSKKVKVTLKNRDKEKESYLNNGYIESMNNKIKLVKRNAYGYRDFKNFKKRALIHLGFGFSIVDSIEENIMMY